MSAGGAPEECRRILFLISSLYGGGAERVCCILASALAGACAGAIVPVLNPVIIRREAGIIF